MRKFQTIYLDHNAATMADPEVISAVAEHLRTCVGNPSSVHSFGRSCRSLLMKARDNIANFLDVRSEEIIFTSGGTEGANMVLQGLFNESPHGHVITSNVEHPCVYYPIKKMEERGLAVSYLEVGERGAVRVEDVEKAIRPETRLIAIMAANHETGVKTDFESIAAIAEKKNIPFFVDGVALLGKEKFVIPKGVSAVAFSGQKMHAIQGSGFCFIRKNLRLSSLIMGGDQQFRRRAGTENLPGIVALSKAIEILREQQDFATSRMNEMRNHFETELQRNLKNVLINGSGHRVANTSNLCFEGVDGEWLLTMLDREGIAASHGSACSSGALEPSRVLLNMYPRDRVNSSVRFSISRFTTDQEIEEAIFVITQLVSGFLQSH